MKIIIQVVFMSLLAGFLSSSGANESTEQEKTMTAKGKFEVNLEPQKDEVAPAGRMIINKSYSGVLEGSGLGQMISKRTDDGAAVYYAIEEFSGTLGGKKGAFTLLHHGVMNKDSQSLEVIILAGSGKGELENISGSMRIDKVDGSHTYELQYTQ